MLNLGIKYITLIACTLMIFVNFIACGAQMYQVSLEDDISPSQNSDLITDPESPQFGLHAPNGWRDLPITFKISDAAGHLDIAQRRGLMRAMATWEMAACRKLFQFDGFHKDVGGDSFPDLYSSLNDAINGHYFDFDWSKTGKARAVLATTIWENAPDDDSIIVTSDIRYNGEHYNITDSLIGRNEDGREVVDMESLALHELGHLLGLAHVSVEHDPNSIMNPSLYIGEGLTNRFLSVGDIERLQRIYSEGIENCEPKTVLARIEHTVRNAEKTSYKQQAKNETEEDEEGGDDAI